ncbi:MAG: PIN domain-containing protein [Candidatus Altiarchaeota archaeon]|nr:PIN domain-containing protein [Candidatus Altiarchaeota archaeon]
MKQTGFKYLLDSSVWLAYFQAKDLGVKKLIEEPSNLLFTSVITLHEVKRKLRRNGQKDRDVQKILAFIKGRSILADVNPGIAEKSADDSIENNLHTLDAIIYRTAMENKAVLATMDHDFKRIGNVLLFPPKS